MKHWFPRLWPAGRAPDLRGPAAKALGGDCAEAFARHPSCELDHPQHVLACSRCAELTKATTRRLWPAGSYHDRLVKRMKRNPIFRFHYWRETRRLRKRAKPDHRALMREASDLVDRARRISREATTAAGARDMQRLNALNAEQTAVVERMQAIAREMGARHAS